jgi:hypothetical protein
MIQLLRSRAVIISLIVLWLALVAVSALIGARGLSLLHGCRCARRGEARAERAATTPANSPLVIACMKKSP